MKKILPIILLIFVSCQKEQKHLSDYVNPFIGTGGHGQTGMVQAKRLDAVEAAIFTQYEIAVDSGYVGEIREELQWYHQVWQN